MSGIKNLAGAVANDPSFMSQLKSLGLSKEELSEIVQPSPKKGGMKTPKLGKGGKY